MFSTLGLLSTAEEDTIQFIGEIPSALWRILSTLERYHQYCGGSCTQTFPRVILHTNWRHKLNIEMEDSSKIKKQYRKVNQLDLIFYMLLVSRCKHLSLSLPRAIFVYDLKVSFR